MEIIENCVNGESLYLSSGAKVMAVCSDGKVRQTTIRGKHAFVRIREMEKDFTVTGQVTIIDGKFNFRACPGLSNYVFLP